MVNDGDSATNFSNSSGKFEIQEENLGYADEADINVRPSYFYDNDDPGDKGDKSDFYSHSFGLPCSSDVG